jgi:RNA-directed DNA polymerase
MTAPKYGWKPLPELIAGLNRHLKGWANYYRLGQPRKAFQRINRYVRQRLYQRLRRSSQRPWKPAPEQTTYPANLTSHVHPHAHCGLDSS